MPTNNNTTPIKMPLPSRRRRIFVSDGSGDSHHHHQSQPQLQQCKPVFLLVSFLIYLNFALLGHLTIHPRNYYREWFPETMVVGGGGIRRSENYKSDEEEQRKGNIKNDLDTNNYHNKKDEQQQRQQDEENDYEEQNRQWQLERPIEIGKREKEKKVPASFYRSEKSMVDVNDWWKMMEQKIQSRQNKQKQQKIANTSGGNNIIDDGYNDSKTKRGKIALIMSYPNSGTSYTSKLVRQASQTTTATNYGMEGLISATDYKSVPVYNFSLDGPYWLHPPTNSVDDGSEIEGEDKQQTKRDVLPTPPMTASILTKTHCGIRCSHCPPLMYVENEETFYQRCLSGARKVPDLSKTNKKKDGGGEEKKKKEQNRYYYKKEFVTYSPNLIHSAIHLIRNPFDNAISRFHHELKEHAKYPTKNQSWMDRYPRNSAGFRRWCNDENTMYGQYERMTFNWTRYGYSSDIINYFEGVSCHAEIVRYALWHSLALRTVERLDVPVMYLYYEDYADDLEGETNKLLSFLNLTRSVDDEGNQVELPEFRQSDYSDYFTLEERAATSELIRRVMKNEKGIELLSRYFTEWDFQKLINQTQDII